MVEQHLPMPPVKDSSLCFRRGNRLLASADFQPLFNQPDIRVGGATLLFLVRNTENPNPRLGLVVGKRRVRSAVHRNRIKRLCRESFRQRQAELANLDILILVKAPIPRVDRVTLGAELSRLWDKLLAKRNQA